MPNVNLANVNKISAMGLIKAAMRSLNVLEAGEEPSDDEATDGFGSLNGMIDAWSIERLMIFTIQRIVYAPTVLKQVYTYGPTGDINLPRPPSLPRMGVITLNNPQQPLEIPMEMLSSAGWANIPVKNVPSSQPLQCWDDQGWPLRNLSLFPIPNANFQLALYPWIALQQFQDFGTLFSFPPGYISALRYGLAVRLAPEYPQSPAIQQVIALAIESKARVQTINLPLVDLRCDPAVVGSGKMYYDWRSDQPAGPGTVG